jgi:hypothetical protein
VTREVLEKSLSRRIEKEDANGLFPGSTDEKVERAPSRLELPEPGAAEDRAEQPGARLVDCLPQARKIGVLFGGEMGPDDRLQLGLERGIRGGLRPAGSPREKLTYDVILPAGGRGCSLASLGRRACPRAHLARRLDKRPWILEPLARLAPLRQGIDAFEEPVRMEVVEIA